MTVGHLLFAVATTGYIMIGIYLEERDLIALFGDQYRRYREQVSMLVPWPAGKSPTRWRTRERGGETVFELMDRTIPLRRRDIKRWDAARIGEEAGNQRHAA